jgi:hypothetical protein
MYTYDITNNMSYTKLLKPIANLEASIGVNHYTTVVV